MDKEIITHYMKFDSDAFLRTYYSNLQMYPQYGNHIFKEDVMQWLHDAFASGKIKGRRLLDIGTGPTIHTIISASRYVDSIFLSDFAPQNRETLKKWLDGTLQHSFEPFLKYAVDLEGNGESPCEREMFLRQKISGICKIDLLQEDPLAPSFFPKFDVITTSLCLISVAEDPVEYEQLARRVADMLADGGHLVLFSFYGKRSYRVGTSWFRSLVIDVEKIQQIWKHCGFEVISFRQASPPLPEHNPHMLYYLMVARKVSSI